MGWVYPRARLSWVEIFFSFLVGWVGSSVRNISKILKLGRPLVTAEVIPDNLIVINTDK